jgi:hypothetical protein
MPDIVSGLKQIWAFWTDFHRSPHFFFKIRRAGAALIHAGSEMDRCDEANTRFSRLTRTRLRVCQDFHYVEANMKIQNEFHNERRKYTVMIRQYSNQLGDCRGYKAFSEELFLNVLEYFN